MISRVWNEYKIIYEKIREKNSLKPKEMNLFLFNVKETIYQCTGKEINTHNINQCLFIGLDAYDKFIAFDQTELTKNSDTFEKISSLINLASTKYFYCEQILHFFPKINQQNFNQNQNNIMSLSNNSNQEPLQEEQYSQQDSKETSLCLQDFNIISSNKNHTQISMDFQSGNNQTLIVQEGNNSQENQNFIDNFFVFESTKKNTQCRAQLFQEEFSPGILQMIIKQHKFNEHKILALAHVYLNQLQQIFQHEFLRLTVIKIQDGQNLSQNQQKSQPNSQYFYMYYCLNHFQPEEIKDKENLICKKIKYYFIIKTKFPHMVFHYTWLSIFVKEFVNNFKETFKQITDNQIYVTNHNVRIFRQLTGFSKIFENLEPKLLYFSQFVFDEFFYDWFLDEFGQNFSKANLKIATEFFKQVSPDAINILLNIPVNDYLFMLFSLLQEHSLVIVGQDSYVTTQLIHFLELCLKPFKWQFPIIYNLPLELETFLNSPIPLIIGVHSNCEKFFKRKFLDEKTKNIFYFADKKILFAQQQDNLELGNPLFGDQFSYLKKQYKKAFGDLKSQTIGSSFFDQLWCETIKKTPQQIYQKMKEIQSNNYKESFKEIQSEKLYEWVQYVNNFFKNNIINKVQQLKEKYKTLEEFQNFQKKPEFYMIFSSSQSDSVFLNKFFQTQMMTQKLQQIYTDIIN